jgi:protein-tyrosine phosphatase
MAGRSRSASIIIAYLIKTFGINAKTSISMLKNKRSIVQPNNSFTKQLNDYYNSLYANIE